MSTITPAYSLTCGEPYDPVLINAIFSALTIGAILGSEIATGTITGSNIASSTITGSNITADAIGASHIASNTISADHLQTDSVTSTKIYAGAVTSDKIYAGAITADKISVDNLAAISANLGEVTAGILTAPTIRTTASQTANRVIMDSSGIRGYDTTYGLTFKLPTDGTAPTFASGVIQNCTIIDTDMYSSEFRTSNTLPWVEMTSKGVAYRESGSGGLYGTATYSEDGSGGTYGAGVSGYYGNPDLPLLTVLLEREYADIRMYNRNSVPSGSNEIGDLAVVGGRLRICTTAGDGGNATWKFPGHFLGILDSAPSQAYEGDTYINTTDHKYYIRYSTAWQELHTLAVSKLLMEDGSSYVLTEAGDKINL